jgi:hypothetical protein
LSVLVSDLSASRIYYFIVTGALPAVRGSQTQHEEERRMKNLASKIDVRVIYLLMMLAALAAAAGAPIGPLGVWSMP